MGVGCCEVGQFCDKMLLTQSVEYVCEMKVEIADARSVRPIKAEARNKERIGNYVYRRTESEGRAYLNLVGVDGRGIRKEIM